MNHPVQQERVANYFAAFAHVLCGRPGRFDDFIAKVEIMLHGSPPHAANLMQYGPQVLETGRPLIWRHYREQSAVVPQLGLVAQVDGRLHYMENCWLMMAPRDKRAILVPDSLQLGSYSFDDDFLISHSPKKAAPSYEVASDRMARAYSKLYAIEAEQLRRKQRFPLPVLARAA